VINTAGALFIMASIRIRDRLKVVGRLTNAILPGVWNILSTDTGGMLCGKGDALK